MNIKQAKEEIKHTVQAYLARDSAGEYQMPVIRQRPILLMGPPGIGKTQIMEQVARECGIGLVSYTITHHTRQSAVGLPFIREKEFQGTSYSVTEYTMSEIIASVYQKMEDTGLAEGILFIDEINCVSETLAPTMLQFLQCKTFGNQRIPAGWMIVAAGNPPEYNRSVREFDMVTLDRVRSIPVEADYRVWKEYAREQNVYGAILSYLEIRPKDFYRVEADVDGMRYVTARGWEDLSHLLYSYEAFGWPVSQEIVYEYLHHPNVAEDVAAYLDLYRKYQDDYGIEKILCGQVKPAVFARVEQAGFDERLSVVNLLSDGLASYFRQAVSEQTVTDAYFAFLKAYREAVGRTEDPSDEYRRRVEEYAQLVNQKERAGFTDQDKLEADKRLLALLRESQKAMLDPSKERAFEEARSGFELQKKRLEQAEEAAGQALEYAFDFMEQAFDHGEEMVIFVTELTVRREAAAFLAEYVCERYLQYNRQLLVGSRKGELLAELNRQ